MIQLGSLVRYRSYCTPLAGPNKVGLVLNIKEYERRIYDGGGCYDMATILWAGSNKTTREELRYLELAS